VQFRHLKGRIEVQLDISSAAMKARQLAPADGPAWPDDELLENAALKDGDVVRLVPANPASQHLPAVPRSAEDAAEDAIEEVEATASGEELLPSESEVGPASDSAPAAASTTWANADGPRGAGLPKGGYSGIGKTQAAASQLALYPHDAEEWRKAFKQAGDGTSCPDMSSIRALRKLIWLQTEKIITSAVKSEGALGMPPLEVVRPATRTERLYSAGRAPAGPGGGCRVAVLPRDLLEVAGELAGQGRSVAVLNMASASCPGGGFRSGAGAQEENLHRRSDAVRFTDEQSKKNYPIPREGCLLSRDVTVFRGSEKEGYPFLEHPFRIALVSCAAITYPRLTLSRDYRDRDARALMEAKVAVIVQAALRASCDVAVLSAFGCGAFGNPPEAVADMFRRALERSALQEAIFCIIEDHNSGGEHNPRGNVRPFQEVFGCGDGGQECSDPARPCSLV